MHISFIKPIPNCSYYLVSFEDMITGSLKIDDDDIISNIDINCKYIDKVQKKLISCLLSELGRDEIEVECSVGVKRFHIDLGFKQQYKNMIDDNLVLIYKLH